MALDCNASVAWPLLLRQLAQTQADFLAGGRQPRAGGAGGAPGSQPHHHHHLGHHHGGLSGPGPQGLVQVQLLRQRFEATAAEGSPEAAGGATDAGVRLAHLLKALGRAPHGVVESKAREWVPLFLEFSAAKSIDGIAAGGCSGRG